MTFWNPVPVHMLQISNVDLPLPPHPPQLIPSDTTMDPIPLQPFKYEKQSETVMNQ